MSFLLMRWEEEIGPTEGDPRSKMLQPSQNANKWTIKVKEVKDGLQGPSNNLKAVNKQ